MNYSHSNFSYPQQFDKTPAPRIAPLTLEEIQKQMTRIETRLVVLMNHMGIDTFGNEI